MPSGLPNTDNVAGGMRSAVGSLSSQLRFAADYLQIPSYNEYSSSIRNTWNDSVQAARSVCYLSFITFRPFIILMGILGRYLAVILKILAECTVKHGIVAAREGAHQANVAVRWIIAWQRGLSRAAILVEIGVIAGFVALYMLRRHLRRKRYFERLKRWYASKKARALRKYNRLLKRVAETSTFLAILLPHLLYGFLVGSVKFMFPWLLRYFAARTYATAAISLLVPLVKTVTLIHQWDGILKSKPKQDPAPVSKSREKIGLGGSERKGIVEKRHRGRKKSVADRYLKSVEHSSTKISASSPKQSSSQINLPGRKQQKDEGSHAHDSANSPEKLYEEAMDLLKYWVVYALVCAVFRVMYMLPVLGRIISATEQARAQTYKRSFFSDAVKTEPFWKRVSLKLSYEFLEESKLVFFLWLRYLPTSLTASDYTNSVGVHAKAAVWEKRVSKNVGVECPNSPLDLVFQRMVPVAVSLVNSSSSLTEAKENANGFGGLLQKGLNFFKSSLDIAVFMKVISEPTKKQIISILTECTALLPASFTLLMPGYFTQYGCVYVSRVIPAANSASTLSTMRTNHSDNDHRLDGDEMVMAIRFLKYWTIHCLLSIGLKAFAPLLAWIPLSTHITWLLWAYSQLESSTHKLYGVFEWELMAFGLLHHHDGDSKEIDIEKTMTVSLFKRVVSSLPSASSSDPSDKAPESNTDETITKQDHDQLQAEQPKSEVDVKGAFAVGGSKLADVSPKTKEPAHLDVKLSASEETGNDNAPHDVQITNPDRAATDRSSKDDTDINAGTVIPHKVKQTSIAEKDIEDSNTESPVSPVVTSSHSSIVESPETPPASTDGVTTKTVMTDDIVGNNFDCRQEELKHIDLSSDQMIAETNKAGAAHEAKSLAEDTAKDGLDSSDTLATDDVGQPEPPECSKVTKTAATADSDAVCNSSSNHIDVLASDQEKMDSNESDHTDNDNKASNGVAMDSVIDEQPPLNDIFDDTNDVVESARVTEEATAKVGGADITECDDNRLEDTEVNVAMKGSNCADEDDTDPGVVVEDIAKDDQHPMNNAKDDQPPINAVSSDDVDETPEDPDAESNHDNNTECIGLSSDIAGLTSVEEMSNTNASTNQQPATLGPSDDGQIPQCTKAVTGATDSTQVSGKLVADQTITILGENNDEDGINATEQEDSILSSDHATSEANETTEIADLAETDPGVDAEDITMEEQAPNSDVVKTNESGRGDADADAEWENVKIEDSSQEVHGGDGT